MYIEFLLFTLCPAINIFGIKVDYIATLTKLTNPAKAFAILTNCIYMNNKFNFQGNEDEMEFMPIIPLNDDEDGGADELPLPEELPLLPLRNTVLFPGVVIPITVGRDKSIKAVTDAYKADKLVGVVAQKDSTIEEPTIADLESTGTVAKLVKLIKMPDGGTTIIIQGKRRFAIEKITSEDPYFKANIKEY